MDQNQKGKLAVLIWDAIENPENGAIKVQFGNLKDSESWSKNVGLIAQTPTILWGGKLAKSVDSADAEILLILHKTVAHHILQRIDMNIFVNRLVQSGVGAIFAPLPKQLNELTGIRSDKLPNIDNETTIGNIPDVRALLGTKQAIAYWLAARTANLMQEKNFGQDVLVMWCEAIIRSNESNESNESSGPSGSPLVEVDYFSSTFPPLNVSSLQNVNPLGERRQFPDLKFLESADESGDTKASNSTKIADKFNQCKTWCKQNKAIVMSVIIVVAVLLFLVIVGILVSKNIKSKHQRIQTSHNPKNDVYYDPNLGQEVKGPILSRNPSYSEFS